MSRKRIAAAVVAVFFAFLPFTAFSQAMPADLHIMRMPADIPLRLHTDTGSVPEVLLPILAPLPQADDCVSRFPAILSLALWFACALLMRRVALWHGAEGVGASAFQCYMAHPHHAPPQRG